MNEKIIARINKLMALTNSPNKNESEKAAEMAFKLMESYGISTRDLNVANLEADLGEIDKQVLKAGSYITLWEKNLANVIASYFDCVSYISESRNCVGRKTYAMAFIGHESNRVTTITMYEWLRKAIWRDARNKFSTYAYQMSFCAGAVNSIAGKYKKEKVVSSEENGLVVYNEVRRWIDENMNFNGTSKSRAVSIYSSAYASGKDAGNGYSLNRQFGLKAIGC